MTSQEPLPPQSGETELPPTSGLPAGTVRWNRPGLAAVGLASVVLLAFALRYGYKKTAPPEPRSTEQLAASVQKYRDDLRRYSRENTPQEWATTQNNLGDALQDQGVRTSGEPGAQLFAQAVEAYRQALLVYTREKLPQDWAMTKGNLGLALLRQGARSAGAPRSQLYAQAADACRQSLLVYTRDQQPEQWAAVQEILGLSLYDQGLEVPGEPGAQLEAEAGEAFRSALLVFRREEMPQDWVRTQNHLGNALNEQGRRTPGQQGTQLLEQAAQVLTASLAAAPDDRDAFLSLISLYDRLFRPQDAVALSRSWLRRHGDDAEAHALLAEQLFASRAFSECQHEVDSLRTMQGLSANYRVVALGYAVASSVATGAPDVRARFGELLAFAAAQPPDFAVDWTFDGALHTLGEPPPVPHRDWLGRLLAAYTAPNREDLLKNLRDVQEAMPR